MNSVGAFIWFGVNFMSIITGIIANYPAMNETDLTLSSNVSDLMIDVEVNKTPVYAFMCDEEFNPNICMGFGEDESCKSCEEWING